MQNIKCKIIAIAGGSGAGKTTLANKISKLFNENECEIISQDNYYIDSKEKFDFDGGRINFDHPRTLELNLLAEHLELLKKNISINIPCYDFNNHSRLSNTKIINPCKIILVDGTLLFNSKKLKSIFDLKIFIKISEKTRLNRRIDRDIKERNRTLDGIINQWEKQVLPMHKKFIQPTESIADLVINEDECLDVVALKIFNLISDN